VVSFAVIDSYMQYTKIKACELYKIALNVFIKYVYSKLGLTFPLLFLDIIFELDLINVFM